MYFNTNASLHTVRGLNILTLSIHKDFKIISIKNVTLKICNNDHSINIEKRNSLFLRYSQKSISIAK